MSGSVSFAPTTNSYSAKLDISGNTNASGDIVITYTPPAGNGISIIPLTYLLTPSTGRGAALLVVHFVNGTTISAYVLGTNSTNGNCNVTAQTGNAITVSTTYTSVTVLILGNPIVFTQ